MGIFDDKIDRRKFVNLFTGGSLAIILGCSKESNPVSKTETDPPPLTPKALNLLFLTTSLGTAFIDIPGIFKELARHGGHAVNTGVSKAGSLNEHLNSSVSMNMLKNNHWNFVFLTENSLIVSSEDRRIEEMYPAAKTLDSLIRSKNTLTVFYVHCAFRDDAAVWAGFAGYSEMQNSIVTGYSELSNELNAIVIPFGLACQNALDAYPDDFQKPLNLWYQDGVHPSMESAYLAACVFYSSIYQESPEGLNFSGEINDDKNEFLFHTYNLDRETALFLQKIAAETVLNNPT